MVRTQIQLTESQAEALKYLAARKKVSMAELIRSAVDAVIQSEGMVDRSERIRRALDAVGKFHSGIDDLAVHHDQYLGETYSE
jgi:metal-responsive CopG/Arc/MetJ family transcriptional regulator